MATDEDEGSGGESSSSSKAEEDQDSDDNEDEEVDEAFLAKIAEALGVNGAGALSDEASEEEDLMDDDQMMAIDDQLAQVFKSRVNDKHSTKGSYDSFHVRSASLTYYDLQSMPNEKLHTSKIGFSTWSITFFESSLPTL